MPAYRTYLGEIVWTNGEIVMAVTPGGMARILEMTQEARTLLATLQYEMALEESYDFEEMEEQARKEVSDSESDECYRFA